jgi:prepilin-type N-terminal cleavage/methylation domain-containing protein/prepilin-type processing-associated H-X9-DG protein
MNTDRQSQSDRIQSPKGAKPEPRLTSRRSLASFTLIELLVVIGIIAVLMTFLFPAFASVRERGRAARCASNLRQLYVAAMNYYSAHNDLPRAESKAEPKYNEYTFELEYYQHHAGWVAWREYVNGYTNKTTFTGSYDWKGAQGKACLTNGVLWAYLQGDQSVYICPTFARECKVPDALRSYSVETNFYNRDRFKSGAAGAVLFGEDSRVSISPYKPMFSTNALLRPHTGKGNVVCFDGHVDRR